MKAMFLLFIFSSSLASACNIATRALIMQQVKEAAATNTDPCADKYEVGSDENRKCNTAIGKVAIVISSKSGSFSEDECDLLAEVFGL
jgi:hypothetical protein